MMDDPGDECNSSGLVALQSLDGDHVHCDSQKLPGKKGNSILHGILHKTFLVAFIP
jgi:hypothetical protein